MVKILLSFLIFMAAPISSAKSFGHYEGFIHRVNDKTYLVTEEGLLQVSGVDSTTSDQLLRFKSYDYISALGYKKLNKIRISNIHHVGLADLIGRWLSQKDFVFEFTNYRDLVVHWTPPFKESNTRHFEYSVRPGPKDSWIIFLVDKNSVRIGQIQIDSKSILLTIIDSKTGDIEEIFDLTKLQ